MTSFYFDPDASGLAVFMGSMEARLMELAWAHRSLTVKKALFHLGPADRPAYTTVMTVLSRLAEKGLLERTKEGRGFAYRPAVNRQAYLENRLGIISGCLAKNFSA